MNHHEEGILYDGMVNPSAYQGVEVHSILDEAELVPNQGVEVHSILDEAELVPNGPFLE